MQKRRNKESYETLKNSIETISGVSVETKKGLLGSCKVCFKEKISRQTREEIERELAKENYKLIWGNDSVLLRK